MPSDCWHQINLGDALTATQRQSGIERDFVAEYERRGRPADMALFIRHVSEGKLHCDVVLYFPPQASASATAANADRCPAPDPEGLGLLAGSPDAWTRLFDKR
ncbi:MAG: hypothetical protein JJU06_09510 [Ectothiorhodospiraceae bacterium]|nr:hypothetical protein [Ectothiorhodospiraceae bacterium]MCH8506915.1 hypothetical protein [Ectothiorhodospiraceae bacterium]